MRYRATIREVAKEAGVSIASVSRVVTRSRPVRPDVEQRVRDAVERLRYRPNSLGRSLSTSSTRSVGLVVPDIGSAFFTLLIQACQRALHKNGLSLLLTDAERSPDEERNAVLRLLDKQVDGLLISPCHHVRSRATVEEAAALVPVVQIDRYATTAVPRVLADPVQTVRMAIEHLHANGYRTFAFVGATSSASTAYARERSFVRCARDYDPAAPARVLKQDFTTTWGRQAAQILTERWPEVDAIVCANDLIAVGLIQRLRDLGRKVPGDVGVTGCDDTLFSEISYPTLTTIAQPLDLMASAAVSMLQHADQRGTLQFAPTLRVRQSTSSRA